MQATTDLRWLLDDLVDRVPGLDRAIVLSADGLLLSRSGTLTDDDADLGIARFCVDDAFEVVFDSGKSGGLNGRAYLWLALCYWPDELDGESADGQRCRFVGRLLAGSDSRCRNGFAGCNQRDEPR